MRLDGPKDADPWRPSGQPLENWHQLSDIVGQVDVSVLFLKAKYRTPLIIEALESFTLEIRFDTMNVNKQEKYFSFFSIFASNLWAS